MANTRPLTTDPLRNFKFNVFIPRPEAGQVSSMGRLGFMQVQGLGIAVEPLTYREGGDNLTTRKMPGQADFNPITLTRGLFPMDNDNWLWMQQLFTAMYGSTPSGLYGAGPLGTSGHNAPYNFRTNIYINILQHPNTAPNLGGGPGAGSYNASYPAQNSIVVLSFQLYSAWIGSLAYSDLDAGGNAVAIEQMTLNYEGFDTYWGGGGPPGDGSGGAGYISNPTSWSAAG